jgi:signal transduction histidine kinase
VSAPDDNAAPLRTGMRRVIPRFEFRRLQAMARVRIAVGTVLAGLAVVTLVGGSYTAPAFGWAAFFLVLGAIQFLVAYWYMTIVYHPLPQRVRELEQSRARVVDDSATTLRRIERDLHDGAQAQMVAVAMKLGLAAKKLRDMTDGTGQTDLDRVLELVTAAHRGAKEAVAELRDLARGIHPPVLDQGLGIALTTLAARSDLPVELVIDLPERPSAAIETIAYYCAAELLTNVTKHSGATQATLEATHMPGLLRVRVRDNGSGGARAGASGGLAGLAERVNNVDGRLQLSSPPGGPTAVTVELPSHA